MELSPVSTSSPFPTFATKAGVYQESKKQSGLFSAYSQANAFEKEVKSLFGRVSVASSKETKTQAGLLTHALRIGKEQSDLASAFSIFKTTLAIYRSDYPDLFPSNPEGRSAFNTKLLKAASLQLFCHFAQQKALSQTEITTIAAMIKESDFPLTLIEIQKAYKNNSECQNKAKIKLYALRSQITALEAKGNAVREQKIARLNVLTIQISTTEPAYQEAKSCVLKLMDQAEQTNFPDSIMTQIEQQEVKVNRLFQKLKLAKDEYDQLAQFKTFVNDFVSAISDDLDTLNTLKQQFADFQAPFKGFSQFLAVQAIQEIKTTINITDESIPNRLPRFRNYNGVLGKLKDAIKAKSPILASRIYYELGYFQSPLKDKPYITAKDALLGELQTLLNEGEASAEELFINFFQKGDTSANQLIYRALDNIKQL